MDIENEFNTRGKILRAAAKMFSERGYDRVTIREIAKAVGINAASIYYHFPSKEGILRSLYKFYTDERSKENLDLNELLRFSKTEPPHEVLMKSEFHYDMEIREFLDHILVTATRGICADDSESEHFIRDNIFDNIRSILKPLLERMIELGKIKPFDIDTFLRVLSYYCFGAAALNSSSLRQGIPEYQAGMSLLYSLIIPTGK